MENVSPRTFCRGLGPTRPLYRKLKNIRACFNNRIRINPGRKRHQRGRSKGERGGSPRVQGRAATRTPKSEDVVTDRRFLARARAGLSRPILALRAQISRDTRSIARDLGQKLRSVAKSGDCGGHRACSGSDGRLSLRTG
jgi:hypothetical protein